MLRLLGRATSGNTQKVIFLLEELKLPYQREDYGRGFNNTQTPEYGRLNPMRRIPTLLDGDLSVWQSNTILRYLAAKTGSDVYPDDPGGRSEVERWMDWQLAEFSPPYLMARRELRKPVAERSGETGSELAAALALLEAMLAERPWVAGPNFSLADIALAPLVRRSLGFPFDMPEFRRVQAWCERLAARPAFRTAVAAD